MEESVLGAETAVNDSAIINLGDKVSNRFLLPVGDGYCLLDTGYKWSYGDFCEKLAKANIPIEKIKYLVLTHMHADHVGFAKELLAATGAELIYDMDDRQRLEAGKNNLNTYISGFFTLIASKVSAMFVDSMQCFPAVFYENARDSKEQPLLAYGISFVTLRGHTEYDVCVKYGDKLFCGDIFMSGICSTKHAPMWIFNKFDLIASWKQILAMDGIKEIYPAHGKHFSADKIGASITYWQTKGVFRLFGRSN